MEVLREDHGLILCQRKFTMDFLKEIDSVNLRRVSSPFDCNETPRLDHGSPVSDPTFYRCLIGKLNYLAHTRPDLAYTVQHLSKFMSNPCQPYLDATLRVLRYLLKDPNLGLFMSSSPCFKILAFCDSEWARCPETRRSVFGFYISLGTSPLSWKSKKQASISLSSAKVEYRSMRRVVARSLGWFVFFTI
ncbi:secreted RxLR effector protein 161-like [Solanum verrucosum]|uniref:secreted RxLR effector protein 161-like n=1 Tax=Solanum verrucosum TaxID=315347 RepID=UPI0020D13427|nr:secreted RxLR effector protein 161-like [Solanum verrucosum]